MKKVAMSRKLRKDWRATDSVDLGPDTDVMSQGAQKSWNPGVERPGPSSLAHALTLRHCVEVSNETVVYPGDEATASCLFHPIQTCRPGSQGSPSTRPMVGGSDQPRAGRGSAPGLFGVC